MSRLIAGPVAYFMWAAGLVGWACTVPVVTAQALIEEAWRS